MWFHKGTVLQDVVFTCSYHLHRLHPQLVHFWGDDIYIFLTYFLRFHILATDTLTSPNKRRLQREGDFYFPLISATFGLRSVWTATEMSQGTEWPCGGRETVFSFRTCLQLSWVKKTRSAEAKKPLWWFFSFFNLQLFRMRETASTVTEPRDRQWALCPSLCSSGQRPARHR